MRKTNNNDNLLIKKSHITHFLSQFVLLSIAAVGRVKVFCHSQFCEYGKKNALPRMSPLPHLPLYPYISLYWVNVLAIVSTRSQFLLFVGISLLVYCPFVFRCLMIYLLKVLIGNLILSQQKNIGPRPIISQCNILVHDATLIYETRDGSLYGSVKTRDAGCYFKCFFLAFY